MLISAGLLGAYLGLGMAEAEAAPGERPGLKVAGGSTVGLLGGALVGGGAGVGIGALSCKVGGNSSSFECWAPLVGLGIGAPVGALGGGVGAGAWTAKRVGSDPRRVALWSGITAGVGVTSLGVGLLTEVTPLQWVGVLALPAVPIFAGVAAGTEEQQRTVVVVPTIGGGRSGFSLVLRQ